MTSLFALASTAVPSACGAPPEGRLLWVCVGAGLFAVLYGAVAFIRRARKP